MLTETKRVVNDDLKPRVQQAWRNAQPEVENAARRLRGFAEELREEYRKGRDDG